VSSLANGSTSELGPCFVWLTAGRRGADCTDCKLPATFTRCGRSIGRSAGSVVLLNQSRIHSFHGDDQSALPVAPVSSSSRYGPLGHFGSGRHLPVCNRNQRNVLNIYPDLRCDIVMECLYHPITGNCHLMHAGRIARDPDRSSQHFLR